VRRSRRRHEERRRAGSPSSNSVDKLSGFAAPYITGWLADFTGQQRAGLWVVGGTMVAAAMVTLVLRAAPEPSSPRSG
jgi:nitrate/nitrite transporter NarK